MFRSITLSLVLLGIAIPVFGQDGDDTISLRITPTPIDPSNHSLRLLPSDTELVDGNAAVVMLRLIGGENSWMRDVAPSAQELMSLPFDDPQIPEKLSFERMAMELRRAALMRDADWEYPLNQSGDLLLPDVTSHRYIAGFGMSLWIGIKIANKDSHAAIEGIQTQLACARHISRTPVLVNQTLGNAVATLAINKLELLVQQPQTTNLYWPLVMLPESVSNLQAALQWESQRLPRILPSLGKSTPAIGDPAWDKVITEFSDAMVSQGAFVKTEAEALVLRMKMLLAAQEQLPKLGIYRDDEISRMTAQELTMRWILATADRINYRVETASSLRPPIAIGELLKIQDEIEKMKTDLGAPGVPFEATPAITYLYFKRFDRFVKLLQITEAVRNEVAINGGKLPDSLDAITSVPIPMDPLTGKSFLYELDGHVVTLKTPLIFGLDESTQQIVAKSYKISLVGSEN